MGNYRKDHIARIIAKLRSLFADAGWGEITVTMKCNGDKVLIVPCADTVPHITDESQVEFYHMESPSVMLYGENTLLEVAQTLAGYEDRLVEKDDDERSLAELKSKLENPEPGMTLGQWEVLYEHYSDFSKLVRGYRDRSVVRPARMGSWDDPARYAAAEAEYARLAAERPA